MSSQRSLQLMGSHEIRMAHGGVSRQRAFQITSRPDFPEPVAELVQGRVWLAEDMERWIATHRGTLDEP